MRENIKILTNNCCDELLKFELDKTLREEYNNEKFDKDLLNTLNSPTKYYIDSNLELSPNAQDDCANSIKIYQQIGKITDVQANDRRLWVLLTHLKFYQYTRERWKIGSNTSNSVILRRFHFEGTGLETRMRNSISRLWWAARITYDETRKNKFELTELLWEKQDLFQNIVERSYGTYENVVKGILEFYEDNRELKESELRILYTGLNALGGVKVLALLSKFQIKEELYKIGEFNNLACSYLI